MRERRFLMVAVMAAVLVTGCGVGPFATHPPGRMVAQCRGQFTLERGGRSRFSLDLYRHNDDFALYATVPGEGIRYRQVDDIGYDNGRLVLDLDSGREIAGRISGGSLEFKGEWEDFQGIFTIDLE